MRKTLTILAVAAALFAGQTMADHAAVNTLQASSVQLTAEENVATASAEGEGLVKAIADLIAAQPNMAAVIVAAATATANADVKNHHCTCS